LGGRLIYLLFNLKKSKCYGYIEDLEGRFYIHLKNK
jgi:hypothetical protein